MSKSLWPHELQSPRFPCPSLSLGVCSNSRPWSRWCHPTISSSFPSPPTFNLSQGDSIQDWRLLRGPWTWLSILMEINPEYSLQRLMLKLQYFDHLMRGADSLEKTLMLGKIENRRGSTEDEMIGWYHRLNGYGFEQTPGDGEGQGSLVCYSLRGCKESDTA